MIQAKSASVTEILQDAAKVLEAGNIETPKLDARILLQAITGLSGSQLISNADELVSQEHQKNYEIFLKSRLAGMPVFRIIGSRDFYGREFKVFPDVLDPRPETELLVEQIVKAYKCRAPSFVEIGVGSGAISVSLLSELEGSNGVATDISPHAIEAACHNAEKLGVSDRLSLHETDCLMGIKGEYDFIVSNPPYIDQDNLRLLDREVLEHDPVLALDGGKKGLEFYEKIFKNSHGFLKQDGRLFLETGSGQHDELIDLASKMGWGLVSKHLDLSRLERIVVFEES